MVRKLLITVSVLLAGAIIWGFVGAAVQQQERMTREESGPEKRRHLVFERVREGYEIGPRRWQPKSIPSSYDFTAFEIGERDHGLLALQEYVVRDGFIRRPYKPPVVSVIPGDAIDHGFLPVTVELTLAEGQDRETQSCALLVDRGLLVHPIDCSWEAAGTFRDWIVRHTFELGLYVSHALPNDRSYHYGDRYRIKHAPIRIDDLTGAFTGQIEVKHPKDGTLAFQFAGDFEAERDPVRTRDERLTWSNTLTLVKAEIEGELRYLESHLLPEWDLIFIHTASFEEDAFPKQEILVQLKSEEAPPQ